MKKTKKQIIELRKSENILLDKAISNHTKNPCSKNAKEVIRMKKIVNELGIQLWEFSL